MLSRTWSASSNMRNTEGFSPELLHFAKIVPEQKCLYLNDCCLKHLNDIHGPSPLVYDEDR